MIRVQIRASSRLSRTGIEQMLRSEPEILILDQTGAHDDSVPDVSVIEMGAEDDGAADWAGEAFDTDIPTILLVDDPAAVWVANMLRSGVRGILPKGISREELVAAILGVAKGLVVLHPEDVEIALPARGPGVVRDAPLEAMTSREMEVLALIADGLSNKEIADRLKISDHTVKFHVAAIMGKLGAASRTEAVTAAIRRGILLV